MDTLSPVNDLLSIDPSTLIDEVTRYLAVVDVFRDLNCEPTWRAEFEAATAAPESAPRNSRIERSAH